MKVARLTLRNFRNIEETTLEPHPQLNFLVGSNGQGKTSFLEALAFLATLRSFRGSKPAEVIRWGCDAAEVVCQLVSGTWTTDLKLMFAMTDPSEQRASKVAFINGKAYKSSTAYLSQRFGQFELGFHAVVFNPSDHDLVRSDPAIRRHYLDRTISAEDIDYLKNLSKYQRILEQRNAVLKSDQPEARAILVGFTEQMVKVAALLSYKRLEWISRLAEHLNNIVHRIAPQQPELRLVYVSGWVSSIEGLCISNNNLGSIHFTGQGPPPSLEILEQAFWKKFSVLEAAEWRAGHSLVGPHRDDWTFFLGGQVLKGHGSQGEVRSALLALKLCEVILFRNATEHRPLFLLDDFSSELDRERRSFLLSFLVQCDLQVFVSTTEDNFGVGQALSGKRLTVSAGKLITTHAENESDNARFSEQSSDPSG
ncbi:DNA replication/repair protein RecF [Bdellovibrionota bacterium FG-1]